MKQFRLNPPSSARAWFPFRSFPDFAKWLSVALVIAALYYGGAKLGGLVALPIPPGNVSAVWLPSPIAWAALLLLGYRFVPAIWMGDILFGYSSFVDSAHSPLHALLLASLSSSGATLEAVLGTFLIQQWIGQRYPCARTQDVFKFVLIAMLAPALNASMGVSILCVSGFSNWIDFPSLWFTWWIGNTISLLVFAPMLLVWRYYPRITLRPWGAAELALLIALLLGIGKIAFGMGYPVEYLLVPCLVWAAYRFGQQGATTGIVVASSMALWGTVAGLGSFVRPSLNESLLLLQTFMGVAAVTTLVLSAALEERWRSKRALEEANEQLENKVEERTLALIKTNDYLRDEINERKTIEEALRRSQAEKTQLITSLQDQTTTLEKTLNDLQQTQAQLIQTEKMSSLGQLVAGVAHEINNPVNFIHGNLAHADGYIQDLLALIELFREGYTYSDPEVQRLVEEIDLDFLLEDLPKLLVSMKVGADRIRQIVLTLRNFSRLDEAEMKPVDIHEGLESTLLILQHRLKAEQGKGGVEIVKQYSPLPAVECYASQLNQVFMNIIGNAVDALQQREKERSDEERSANPNQITIQTKVSEPGWVSICIKDNGVGMTKTVRDKLFDPFFTTKPVGQGTGLGLSISHQIVTEKHKGQLKCHSEPGQGAEFWITIPIKQPGAS